MSVPFWKDRRFTWKDRFWDHRNLNLHGIYGLDLSREAARSGVPVWWRPGESRRARCVSWGAHRYEYRQMKSNPGATFFQAAMAHEADAHEQPDTAPTAEA